MERYPDDPRPAPDLSAGPIKTVGVVSTGVIGASFVALFLKHNLRVLVCSPSGSPESAPRLAAYLARVWPSLGAHPAASPSNYDFVGPSFDVRHYAELDFVQECAPERPELKRALLARLDAGLALAGRPGVVVASSSSGMVPGALAADCEHHPGRVLVGHPFNPPHLVPLVEVVPHPGGSPAASQAAFAFYRALGRRPVLVRKETPGFVANRLQVALLREAFSLVLDGVVSAEELDICVTEALGPRWALSGPFMTNVLGGGGTKDGFKHIITHLAPMANKWLDDMDAKQVDIKDASNIDRLDASVQEMLKGRNLEAFQKQWGESLVDVFQLKRKANYGAWMGEHNEQQ